MKFLGVIIFPLLFSFAFAQQRVVCYYPGSWVTGITPDPTICTHIIYAFLNVGADGSVVSFNSANDFSSTGNIAKFTALRSQSSTVKLMMGIGGQTASNFPHVAASSTATNAFANSITQLVSNYNLDGVDIDWEFPAGSDNFVGLLTAIRKQLPAGKLLSIAVAPDETRASSAYNVPKVAAIVDFINLMTYDFHGGWETQTYFHSSLYTGTLDTSVYWKTLNVDACVGFWVSQQVPKDKLVVGVPLYGKSYTLVSASNNGVGAPATGTPGNPDTPLYNQICLNVINSGWANVYYARQGVSYAYKGTNWVGYDDLDSLAAKANYVRSSNLGGIMFWSIDQDDYSGACGKGKFPMISLAYNILLQNSAGGGGGGGSNVTPTSTASTTTTAAPAGPFTCPQSSGIFANPGSCTSYISCANGIAYTQNCPSGLNFNALAKYCDYPANAPCNSASASTLASTTASTTKAPTLPPASATTTTTKAPTLAPATTTKAPTVTSTNACAGKTGVVANPADCKSFYNCANGVGALMTCGSGLGFNPSISACDWKANIPGCV